jgi:hypothetical protein
LIERHDREKSAVWVDGDGATFFFRGEVEQVTLILSGEAKPLRHLEGTGVGAASVELPGLAKEVFCDAFASNGPSKTWAQVARVRIVQSTVYRTEPDSQSKWGCAIPACSVRSSRSP